MVERRAGEDGLAAGNGQEIRGWHYWVDPRDGIVYRRRDADDFIREAGSGDEGYYGNSALATLREPPTFRGRHTKPLIPKDSSP